MFFVGFEEPVEIVSVRRERANKTRDKKCGINDIYIYMLDLSAEKCMC